MGFEPTNPNGTTPSASGTVWMPITPQYPLTGHPTTRVNGGYFNADQVNSYFGVMTTPDYKNLASLTGKIVGDKNPGGSTLQWAWQNAVQYAAAANAADPSKRVSPWDILKNWARVGKVPGGGSGGGGGGGTSHSSQTSTSVQKISASQAKGVIGSAMESLVGRAYTPEEVQQFVDMFNQQSAANPQVTKTTSTTHSSGSSSSTSSSSTSSGGIDPNVVATEFAKSRPDYAEFQTAVPLMDAFISAIRSPV